MRPDIVQHSQITKQIVLLELSVPWESRIEKRAHLQVGEVRKAGCCAKTRHSTIPLALKVGARDRASFSAYDAQQLRLKSQLRSRSRVSKLITGKQANYL